jgi:hypothetical protein
LPFLFIAYILVLFWIIFFIIAAEKTSIIIKQEMEKIL